MRRVTDLQRDGRTACRAGAMPPAMVAPARASQTHPPMTAHFSHSPHPSHISDYRPPSLTH